MGGTCGVEKNNLQQCSISSSNNKCINNYTPVLENENDPSKCSCRCIKKCDSNNDCDLLKEKCDYPKENPSTIDERIININDELIHTKIPNIMSENIESGTCTFIKNDSNTSGDYKLCVIDTNKCGPNKYEPTNIGKKYM